MPWRSRLVLLLSGALLAATAGARTVEADWCTVELPDEATVGKPYEFSVRLKGVAAGPKLAADLHFQQTDGSYGGFDAWGGDAQTVTGDGPYRFRPTVADKPGLGAVTVLLYLSPTGGFAERTKEFTSPPVPAKWLGKSLANATFKRSWLWIDDTAVRRELAEGDTWEVPVEYSLDASEDDGETKIVLWAAGPWIDNPDGKYTTDRHHIGYPGTSAATTVAAGRGRHVFSFKVPPAQPRNSLILIGAFQRRDGQRWPWEVRAPATFFHRVRGWFELESAQPGNLFTYAQPVEMAARLLQSDGRDHTLNWTALDTTGAEVARGSVPFVARQVGQVVPIVVATQRRGTLLLRAEVAGWEARAVTLARIPDVLALTRREPTQFGMTNVVLPGPPARVEAACRIARRLGLTSCRTFMDWKTVEPGRGEYRLAGWEEAVATAARLGVVPWFCLVDPPAWAQLEAPVNLGYTAFRGDLDGWRGVITRVTNQFRGRFYGWEWLNEITPGGTPTPVDDYLALCRAGTAAAKAADPATHTILAGGLWPRSFRQAVLKAGAGGLVDVLPVHYADGAGVAEAAGDLAAVGQPKVEVWDDETARGISIWGAPPEFDLTHPLQRQWLLSHWPDELLAGSRRIIWFGGWGDAAGNWSYLLDDLSPRPVAASMAVLVSRLHGARPLGKLAAGQGGVVDLFERDGRAVVLVSSSVEGENVPLPVGVEQLTVVDDQGNESPLACPGRVARLKLAAMPVWLDGADLDVLKSALVPDLMTRTGGEGTPKINVLRGGRTTLTMRLRNLYARQLTGRLSLSLPAGWTGPAPLAFDLAPGAERLVPLPIGVPGSARTEDFAGSAGISFGWDKLPPVTKPLTIAVIAPETLGNLVANGELEQPGGWTGNAERIASTALGDGLGEWLLRFGGGADWQHESTEVPVRGGESYLYSAWVWNRGQHAGSNVTLHFADGTRREMYDVQVFTCGEDNPGWQLYTSHFDTPPNTVKVSLTPVVRGAGSTLYDNLRLTTYDGTDYAAEARRAARPPVIDGRLDDWTNAAPIPLLGPNQLTRLDPAYRPTADNLSGVAWLRWDEDSLYLAARLRDDRHVAQTTGEATTQGDSLTLALDPSNRGPESSRRAFCYLLSSASPGGGSGRQTLYRPPTRSGGLSSGQLAKDSSVYSLAILRGEGVTVYELRMPWKELGAVTPDVGTRLGLSLSAFDNDGAGPAAAMGWGEGLLPAWAPQRLGVLTLVP